MISNRAAKASAAPDMISYIGNSFLINWPKPDFIAFSPSNLAKIHAGCGSKKN